MEVSSSEKGLLATDQSFEGVPMTCFPSKIPFLKTGLLSQPIREASSLRSTPLVGFSLQKVLTVVLDMIGVVLTRFVLFDGVVLSKVGGF